MTIWDQSSDGGLASSNTVAMDGMEVDAKDPFTEDPFRVTSHW